MNLFDQAKKVADAATTSAQTLGTQINQATQTAKHAMEEAAEIRATQLQQWQDSTQAALQQGVETLRQVPQQWAQTVDQMGANAHTAARESQPNLELAITAWQTALAGAATSGMVVTQALKDLPRTAQELAVEMPKLARRMQTAGVRVGDSARTEADVMGLFNKIPGTTKLGANERDMRVFLADKHGSHIRAHAQGGGNGADNIVWELGTDNLRRGADLMTGQEQLYIRFYNAVDSVVKNSATLAKVGMAATGTAVLTQALVTAMAYTLDLHRGDITIDEFRDHIVAAAVSAGLATPIFFLILIAVMALFPEVVIVLSAPAVIAGFNALFGVSIALPIVQSILRHLEAGGFGEDAQAQYASALQQGEELVQTSSEDVKRWWMTVFPMPRMDVGG